MPRKLRNPKQRRGPAPTVTRALYHLLLWGEFSRACAIADEDGTDAWELFDNGTHAAAWAAIVADALREWVTGHPGTRPASWWYWSGPELRRVYGRFEQCPGVGRCHQTGVPYGHPLDWSDRPMVESEAACLDRLGLFLPGERARVPAAAFDAEPFSFTLAVQR